MEGVIDFLLRESIESEFLRKNCIYYIFPMLNPDGVVVGNYRTSLAGCDLNRKWNLNNKSYTPCIYNIK